MKISDLSQSFKHKERTLKDLSDYLKNKSSEYPNFNLFLGAGCSISSGIRGTKPMIEEWLKEHWNNYNQNNEEFDIEKTIKLLKNQENYWFNEKALYSCLFEKKYDLPRQRKNFIEKEVENKFPNIGYAYLVNLFKYKYINANFTTNFDDLLSDAFTKYGNISPLVCSHESTINSITLNTNKPKIIKLHGDYLYDDLKSTENETKSLEINMRNKLTEFCKDSGLIVVGYSGNDKSIVEVMKYMIKNDNYLNHGMYWCLRKDDQINDELRSLLMKEKMYYIVIEGFDEMFAYIHNKLIGNILPFSFEPISNSSDLIIQKLYELNGLLKNNNELIARDLKKIKQENTNNIFKNFFELVENKNKNAKNVLESDEYSIANSDYFDFDFYKKKNDINNYINIKDYEKALEIIDEELQNFKDDYYFEELQKIKAEVFIKRNELSKARECYEFLIQKDIKQYINFIKIAELSDSIADLNIAIGNAIQIDKYFYLAYNVKIKKILEFIDNNKEVILQDYIIELINLIDNSVLFYPYYQNEVFHLFLEIISHKLKSTLNNNIKSNLNIKFKEFLDKIKCQDPTSLIYFQYLRLNVEFKICDLNDENDFTTIITNFIRNNTKQNVIKHIKMICNYYFDLFEYEKINEFINLYNNLFSDKPEFALIKAEFSLKYKNDLSQSISILERFLTENKYINKLLIKQLILYYQYDFKFDKALKLIETYNLEEDISLIIDFYTNKKEYQIALNKLESELNFLPKNEKLIFNQIYLLLHLEKYVEVKEYAHKFLSEGNKWIDQDYYVVIINYEFACKKLTKKVDKERLNKIYKTTTSKFEKAIAALLLDNKNECIEILVEENKKDQSQKYTFKDWKILEEINDELKYKSIFS